MRKVVISLMVILLLLPVITVNARTPMFEHSQRTWVFEELIDDQATDHIHLVVNNSFDNLGFGFDEILIQGFFGIFVSAFSPAGNEIAIIELMYLDTHNSTHLKAFAIGGGAFITNGRVRTTINPLWSDEFFFSPNHTDFVLLSENVNNHDIIIRTRTDSQIVHSFGTILTITYFRTEIILERDFIDEIYELDEIIDIPLVIIFFPILLITSGDIFLVILGWFFLILLLVAIIEIIMVVAKRR